MPGEVRGYEWGWFGVFSAPNKKTSNDESLFAIMYPGLGDMGKAIRRFVLVSLSGWPGALVLRFH